MIKEKTRFEWQLVVRNALTPLSDFWFISVSGGMIHGPGTLSGGSEATAAVNESGAAQASVLLSEKWQSSRAFHIRVQSPNPQLPPRTRWVMLRFV